MFNFDNFVKSNLDLFDGKSQEEIEEIRKYTEPFGIFITTLFEMSNKKKTEVKRIGTITNITAEMGEECNVDVNVLHETLEKLPAEMYLKLFHKMQTKIYRYFSPFANCGCTTLEDPEGDNG